MIAEKLVKLRTEKGVTQEDVANSLAVSNKTVSKWENGMSSPDIPMLIELSRYYGVTTDTLLGLSDNRKRSTKEEVGAMFSGLDRKESILKAFETARSIVPALFGARGPEDASLIASDDAYNVYPDEIGYRNNISRRDFYEFDVSTEDVNIAVMMLRNRANFAWMTDPEKQKEIVKMFKFLSSGDVLTVMHFIHSTACSDVFTADYISKNTDVDEERTMEILDEFCAVGDCRSEIAHLAEGEVKVYECFGDGIILSLISLAYEWRCGDKAYGYHNGGKCKMIGGEKYESVG